MKTITLIGLLLLQVFTSIGSIMILFKLSKENVTRSFKTFVTIFLVAVCFGLMFLSLSMI